MPRRRRPQVVRQLTPFERGRIVGLREGGCSYRQIARMVNRSVSTIVQCWDVWSVENRDRRAQGSGRPRRTTNRQDRHLRLLAFRDHHMSTNSVAAAWYNVVDRVVSVPTIYRRVRSWGLHSYRPHRVRRLRGERHNLAFSVARTAAVMVWGAICCESKSLVFIQGTMTAQQYIQEVLELVVAPYLQDIPNAL
ncbi:HTH 38 and/or DDE 3 domain containing protein [Asbolus verrucosus]|uniref:HTH 38 and/or DDE 3 domain containing protein n=1 Tax=Asbolus verrucosus TaxID=1661398 RepID=A0A482V1G9_ASBVE|nr:HTH 38 and/or DDE 3 domain containing protein [Asbolus verrucosus]